MTNFKFNLALLKVSLSVSSQLIAIEGEHGVVFSDFYKNLESTSLRDNLLELLESASLSEIIPINCSRSLFDY